MNYFELFELPISLKVNHSLILKKYYQLLKEFHPDNFSLDNSQNQDDALQKSASINGAKIILDSPYKRLEYLLKENDIIKQDEKYTLSALFLGQMMDINEQLMELEFEKNDKLAESIHQDIQAQEDLVFLPVKHFFDMEELQASHEDWLLLKDYYFKKKYLTRIKDQFQ